MKKIILRLLCLILLLPAPVAAFDHTGFNKLLKQAVSQGKVAYKALWKNPDPLDTYLEKIAHFNKNALTNLSRNDQLAFYINAYNAITLKRILDHYPPQKARGSSNPQNSILNIPGAWDKIKNEIAGKQYTLNDLEHQVIRPLFKEPRIHFALVCAALGCPILRAESYQGATLEKQLDSVAAAFFHDPKKNYIDHQQKTIYLSALFDWYGDDFIQQYGNNHTLNKKYGKKQGAVLHCYAQYLTKAEGKRLLTATYTIKYLPYNWSLNSQ